jgi:hypothetical protein
MARLLTQMVSAAPAVACTTVTTRVAVLAQGVPAPST